MGRKKAAEPAYPVAVSFRPDGRPQVRAEFPPPTDGTPLAKRPKAKRATPRAAALTSAARTLVKELADLDTAGESPVRRHLDFMDECDGAPLREAVESALRLFQTQKQKAEKAREGARVRAAPLVAAAVTSKLRSQRELADYFGVSDSTISQWRSQARPSKLRHFQLESALEAARTRLQRSEQELAIAHAHRWQWTVLGHRLGMSNTDLAAACLVSEATVRKDLAADSSTVARHRERLATTPGVTNLPLTDAQANTPERLAIWATVEEVVTTHAADPGVLLAAGCLYKRLGIDTAAERAWKRGVEAGSGCAAQNLAARAAEVGEHEQVARWLAIAEELGHNCPAAAWAGDYLLERGQEDEALAAWKRAAARGVAIANAKLARHYHERGDHEEESGWWERGAAAGDPESLAMLANHHARNGNSDAATELFKVAAQRGDASAACRVGKELIDAFDPAGVAFLEQASKHGHRGATAALISHLYWRSPPRALSACERLLVQGIEPPAALFAGLLVSEGKHRYQLENALVIASELACEDPVNGHLIAAGAAKKLHETDLAVEHLWKAARHIDMDYAPSIAESLIELEPASNATREERLISIAEEALARGITSFAPVIADLRYEEDDLTGALAVLRNALASTHDPRDAAELEAEETMLRIYAAVESERLATLRIQNDILEAGAQRLEECAARGSRTALLNLALLHQSWDFLGANDIYQRLVDQGEPYHRELADVLTDLGRIHDAMSALRDGIAEGETDCYAAKGVLAKSLGDDDDALACWIEGSKFDWESACQAAVELEERGETHRARAILEFAAERGSSCAWNLLGSIELRASRKRAIHAFRQGMKGSCFHAAFNLAVVSREFTGGQRRLERREALQVILRGFPHDLEAAILFAELTHQEGRAEVVPVLEEAALNSAALSELVTELSRTNADTAGYRLPADLVPRIRREVHRVHIAHGAQ
jgi:hypothetical protein